MLCLESPAARAVRACSMDNAIRAAAPARASATRALAAASVLVLAGCDLAYPEVVIANKTTEEVELRDLSYQRLRLGHCAGVGPDDRGRALPPRGGPRPLQEARRSSLLREQAEDETIDDCARATRCARRGLETRAHQHRTDLVQLPNGLHASGRLRGVPGLRESSSTTWSRTLGSRALRPLRAAREPRCAHGCCCRSWCMTWTSALG